MEYTSSSNVAGKATSNILTKTFKYMFLGILITAIFAGGLGALWQFLVFSPQSTVNPRDAYNVSYGIMIGGGIAAIITSVVSSVYFLKQSKHLLVVYILYTIFMGITLSGLVAWVDWKILLAAVGITALAFGLMTIIGVFSKGNLSMLAVMGISIFSGAAILSLVLLIVSLTTPGGIPVLYWIIDFAIFVAIMLFTICDINAVKQMADAHIDDKNVAIMCALRLYTDVIYIFVRIVYYISIATRR